MKEILFLFLIDYSGSMYQTFDKSVKYETVYQNVNGIVSVADPNSLSTMMIFGTDTNKSCNDIKAIEAPTKRLSQILFALKPDKFGQTPLARTLKKGVDYAIENNVRNLIAITDGADSCHDDPCLELTKANERLKSAKKKISLLLIGYDIAKEGEKFQCFKNLKLSQIQIDFVSANESFQLQQRLAEKMANIQQMALEANINDRKSDPQSPSDTSQKKSKEKKDRASKDASKLAGDAILEILGAPSLIQFMAHSKTETKSWYGSFAVLLPAGEYTVKSSDPRTQQVRFQIGKGQRLTKNWADFFTAPKSQLNITSRILSYEWIPSPQTKAIHRAVDPFITYGQVDGRSTSQQVPFGDWTMKLISPPWLKNVVPERKVVIEPLINQELGGTSTLKIEWVSCPDPKKSWVVQISSQGKTERHFIQPGVDSIPVLEGMQVEWLSGPPQAL